MLTQHLRPTAFSATLAAALLLLTSTALASDEHQHQVLGTVHFPVTCTAEAQATFDEAMKRQHSFWYRAAIDGFEEVLADDPSCVMAYWGKARALLENPFSPPPPANLPAGLAALEEAQAIGAKSEREADWIEALSTYYRDHETVDHRTRQLAYEQAMEQVAARYPDDPEARIYYALSVVAAHPPTDKTYARLLKAAEILEAEWERQPDHPGVAHYLIHTYDVPALAQHGLKAAERYSEIAPDAPHALHMPSHIFTRVGYWEESVASNARSAEVARKDDSPNDELHALDYMVYAHLQLGQIEAAKRVLEAAEQFVAEDAARGAGRGAAYAIAAMPARLALEQGAWKQAAGLEARATDFAFADALTPYARALGLARAGRPDDAEQEIELLESKVEALRGKDEYWTEQIDIQRQAAEAWVSFAKGQRDEAVGHLQEAAEREARTEKHAITPGPLAPAREQLAEMLLEMDRPAEALAEFEAVLVTEPNRFRAIYGAGRAAELSDNPDIARKYYAELIDLGAKADTARPELVAAQAFVSAN